MASAPAGCAVGFQDAALAIQQKLCHTDSDAYVSGWTKQREDAVPDKVSIIALLRERESQQTPRASASGSLAVLPSPQTRPDTGDEPQQLHMRIDNLDRTSFDAIIRPLLLCGDAARALKLLPDRSVQTVVTSPPYWSLRDYGIEEQIGRDDSLKGYIGSIVNTFEQIERVLRDDGTVWLNVGDSYTSGNRRYRAPDRKNRARAMAVRPPTPEGLKPKDLIGVPWRLAFALQDAGWWIRSEVIWHKPNAHPESVRDRPTKAHETVFLLSKNKDYYYDHKAIKGPRDRRLRTVWEIPTEPVKRVNGQADDHPAMMPLSLARYCVAITSRNDSIVLDPYAGSGTTLLAARELGRQWVGVEINPAFADLIERRLGGHEPR